MAQVIYDSDLRDLDRKMWKYFPDCELKNSWYRLIGDLASICALEYLAVFYDDEKSVIRNGSNNSLGI